MIDFKNCVNHGLKTIKNKFNAQRISSAFWKILINHPLIELAKANSI